MGVFRRPVSHRRFVKSRKVGKARRPMARTSPSTRIQSSTAKFAIQGANPGRTLVHRGIGFPDNFKTNLVYADSIVLTPSVGTPTPSKGYRLTSLYDPDIALGGGQPYWFDQLMAVYSRFKVLGAKMTCIFSYTNVIVADVGPTIVGIECGDISSLSTTSPSVLRMTSNVSSDVLTTQSEPKTVVATYAPGQAFGDLLTDALTGTASADPGRNWNGIIFAAPQGVNVTQPINVLVTIEYFAEFTQMILNSGS